MNNMYRQLAINRHAINLTSFGLIAGLHYAPVQVGASALVVSPVSRLCTCRQVRFRFMKCVYLAYKVIFECRFALVNVASDLVMFCQFEQPGAANAVAYY